MPRVIVTGCAGFIGSHLSELLLNSGYQVLGIDNFLAKSYSADIKKSNLQNLLNAPGFTFMELDLLGKIDSKIFKDGDFIVNEIHYIGKNL